MPDANQDIFADMEAAAAKSKKKTNKSTLAQFRASLTSNKCSKPSRIWIALKSC
jgi:hypothetical protein